MPKYNPAVIEPKWQGYWEQHRTFATARLPETGREKLYVLDMFPYPSGSGLHVGHPEGYTATDIVCRYSRMKGKHESSTRSRTSFSSVAAAMATLGAVTLLPSPGATEVTTTVVPPTWLRANPSDDTAK